MKTTQMKAAAGSETGNFARRLLEAAQQHNPEEYPFIQGVLAGTISRAALRSYAAEITTSTESFLYFLSAILAQCTDIRARHLVLSNLLEEEGVLEFRNGEGLTADTARRHNSMARLFARAAGATEEQCSEPGVNSKWVMAELRAGRWIGPLAFIAVGYEANIPPTFRALLQGLRTNYGFREAELIYFTEHLDADERHSAHGAEIIAAAARTPEDQQEALKGALRGATAWRWFHKRHHDLNHKLSLV